MDKQMESILFDVIDLESAVLLVKRIFRCSQVFVPLAPLFVFARNKERSSKRTQTVEEHALRFNNRSSVDVFTHKFLKICSALIICVFE